MNTLKLIRIVAFALAFVAMPVIAKADGSIAEESEVLRLRAKFGYTFFTGTRNFGTHDLDEVSAAIDVSKRLVDNFELGANIGQVFLAAGSHVYLIGLTPAWGADYGRLHLHGGLFAGVMAIHDEYPTIGGYAITRATRFALGPVAGADVTVIDRVFVHASMQFAKAFGPEDNLGSLGLMAGLGYKF